MEWFLLYLLAITLKVNIALFVVSLVFAFSAAVMCSTNKQSPWIRKGFTYSLITLLVWCVIPPQRDLALIIAGAAAYKVLTTPEAKELGGKGLALLNRKLDRYLEEDTKVVDK